MTDPRFAATIADAKRIAEALLVSHVGDVNAMGSEQALSALDELKGNEALTFATIRVLAGAGVAMATGVVAETLNRGSAEFDARVATALRWVVDKLEYTVND